MKVRFMSLLCDQRALRPMSKRASIINIKLIDHHATTPARPFDRDDSTGVFALFLKSLTIASALRERWVTIIQPAIVFTNTTPRETYSSGQYSREPSSTNTVYSMTHDDPSLAIPWQNRTQTDAIGGFNAKFHCRNQRRVSLRSPDYKRWKQIKDNHWCNNNGHDVRSRGRACGGSGFSRQPANPEKMVHGPVTFLGSSRDSLSLMRQVCQRSGRQRTCHGLAPEL